MSLIGPSATLRRCGPCGRIALLLLSGLVITTFDTTAAARRWRSRRRLQLGSHIVGPIRVTALLLFLLLLQLLSMLLLVLLRQLGSGA